MKIGSKEHREAIANRIKGYRNSIDTLNSAINELAKLYIKDFHWMDYKVSTFWECEESPIGMCVFKIEECRSVFIPTYCRYCHGPVERK